MRFSERNGHVAAKAFQIEELDGDLRNSLWNVLSAFYFDEPDYTNTETSTYKYYHLNMWMHYFKYPLDEIPFELYKYKRTIKTVFQKWEWFKVLDYLEATVDYFNREANADDESERVRQFTKTCNSIFEREKSGYRFVDFEIAPITSENEIESIEEAIACSISSEVSEHFSQALALMNDRDNPDYRNSIKESISAVEAVSRFVSGLPKATLGDALKKIEGQGKLHPALKTSFSSLYGYTSDSNGIRHALSGVSSLSFDDAKYMLVSCTAFANYLLASTPESN